MNFIIFKTVNRGFPLPSSDKSTAHVHHPLYGTEPPPAERRDRILPEIFRSTGCKETR